MGLKRTDEFRQDAVRIALTSGLTRKQVRDGSPAADNIGPQSRGPNRLWPRLSRRSVISHIHRGEALRSASTGSGAILAMQSARSLWA